jgi:hypothetical protein
MTIAIGVATNTTRTQKEGTPRDGVKGATTPNPKIRRATIQSASARPGLCGETVAPGASLALIGSRTFISV